MDARVSTGKHSPGPRDLLRRPTLTGLHFLERFALGLFDEEPDEHDQGEVEDGKHHERLPPQVLDGMRCRLGEDEVEQPLRGRPDCDAGLADARWEDLAHVYLRTGYVSTQVGICDV